MPRNGQYTSSTCKSYFRSLDELDEWAQFPPNFRKPLPYFPRNDTTQNLGKLLVCHDYKGGYTEKPDTLSYTFNFWSACDTFIYFAHHRVAIPPPGWITASHRQGVKMLGTIIFEGGAEPDCLRLLVGKLPKDPSGPAVPQSYAALPVSSHYARILAQLAYDRGFDGYLLNFECALQGQFEQARCLVKWIALLRRELQSLVGAHAEVIWYDSVIVNGELRWQDRLNTVNLPFFLPATGFFTNYTWRNQYPALTTRYFSSVSPHHLGTGSSLRPNESAPPKTIRDVYMGIDVWGRGSHGGGGFGSYKALSHISPGSVALFGQAWTWETEQDKPGWDWFKWWDYETRLWVGPRDSNEVVHVPEIPNKPGEPDCVHGPFVPITKFFQRKSPPDPKTLAFHTSFCPGVGQKWFIDGVQVSHPSTTQVNSPASISEWWTDLAIQTSLGDFVWPKPILAWQGVAPSEDVPLPLTNSAMCMTSAWNGGSSLRVSLTSPGDNTDDAAIRNVWLPIQQLSVTAEHVYTASIVFKVEHAEELDLDVGISLKSISPQSNEPSSIHLSPPLEVEKLHDGWGRLEVDFTPRHEGKNTTGEIALGITISIVSFDPARPLSASLLIGQMNVYSKEREVGDRDKPIVLWASFTQFPSTTFSGKLHWETAYIQPPMPPIPPTPPTMEDPTPYFPPPPGSEDQIESFMYFHVYAKRYERVDYVGVPNDTSATWIGSTGWDPDGGGGFEKSFGLDEKWLPPLAVPGLKRTRIFIRGVTNIGRVSAWEDACYVDIL